MVLVFDDLLDKFDYYKNNVKRAHFKDVVSQGQKYSDISQDVLPVLIYDAMQKHLDFKTANVLSFLRAYRDIPEYRHPMWIHTDVLFADYIGIFMIQSTEFPQDDGVSLWFNNELQSHELNTKDHTGEKNKIVDSQSMDPEKWTLLQRIEFKPNRLVMFPASYFHSKTTLTNYGKNYDDCRIVHILFFNRSENV